MKPLQFCNEISPKFQKLADAFGINYTSFIRTTSLKHKEAVTHFWETLVERGFIYKSKYEGWYCLSDETFVSDLQTEDVVRDNKTIKVSLESGNPVEWSEEDNYMFKLSAFREELLNWLDSNPCVIEPTKFQTLNRLNIENDLPDISVSRPASRLHWGIPVPGDSSQTIYVWLDALVNYLTVAGYPHDNSYLPIDCHVIGKDILKFHAIYWPAFLLAAGLELPKKYICHSHWMVDGTKMSKSKGNVIDPFKMKERYGVESLRYYLLREGVPHMDGSESNKCSYFSNDYYLT